MPNKNFLHVYLSDSPDAADLATLLEFYGFTFLRDQSGADSEPSESHWVWKHLPLSTSGFKLAFYDSLYSDDLSYGKFESFLILEGTNECSQVDLAYMDIMTKFLIDRYGGYIHNPNYIGEERFLCGAAA